MQDSTDARQLSKVRLPEPKKQHCHGQLCKTLCANITLRTLDSVYILRKVHMNAQPVNVTDKQM